VGAELDGLKELRRSSSVGWVPGGVDDVETWREGVERPRRERKDKI